MKIHFFFLNKEFVFVSDNIWLDIVFAAGIQMIFMIKLAWWFAGKLRSM